MMYRRLAPLMLVFLLACPSPAGPRPPAGEKPIRGGTLRVALAEDVDSLDPQLASSAASLALMRLLHRGLMAFPAAVGRAGMTPEPDLAEDLPTVAADGLTYTFELRQGPTFGSRQIVADDVRAGLERIFTSRSPYRSYFKIIQGADDFEAGRTVALAGVSAPTPTNVVVRLTRPANDLLSILALPAASAIPADLPRDVRATDIPSSGPYKLDRYDPEQQITFSRSRTWTRKADPIRPAYVDSINVTVESGAAAVRAKLLSGATDLSLDTSPNIPEIVADPALRPRTLIAPSGCLRYLWMNTKVIALKDRVAVANAVDRASVLAAAGGVLAGVQASSPLVRTIIGSPDAPLVPVKASGLLVASPSVTSSASLVARVAFSATFVVGDRPEDRAQADAIVRSLSASGIKVVLKVLPIASLYTDAYENSSAPMGLATWCADWPGIGGRAMLAPLVSGGADYSGLHDKAVDAALRAATVAPLADALEAWRAAVTVAAGTAAVVPLVDLNEVSLTSPRVHLVATPLLPRGDLTVTWLTPASPDTPSPSASAT